MHVSLFMFCRIKEKTDLRRKVCYFPCCTDYHVFLPSPIPNRRFGSNRWFIDEGPGCTIKRLPSLTPTTTVSSPWNFGRNRSPRKISDWFRGRKRHSTFMLHSAGTSAIAQIQGGGRMLLSVEGKDAAEAAGDQSLIGAWSHRQNKRRGVRSDLSLLSFRGLWTRWRGWTVLFWLAATGCNLIMRSWKVFFVAARRTKLDVKPRNDRLHH